MSKKNKNKSDYMTSSNPTKVGSFQIRKEIR